LTVRQTSGYDGGNEAFLLFFVFSKPSSDYYDPD
jgi:hypothetical protein